MNKSEAFLHKFEIREERIALHALTVWRQSAKKVEVQSRSTFVGGGELKRCFKMN